MAEGTWRERLSEVVEQRMGLAITPRERLAQLEEADIERGALRRELDSLAWTALDYLGGKPQDLKVEERRKLVQKARVVWQRDPQAGAAVELMNDFVFGRGIPKPQANDELVQEVIDEFWDDPDNQETLTGFAAQMELGTDLQLQANLFFLVFDDGDDGKVKLAMLDHDTVVDVVRDTKEYRRRVLFYVAEEAEELEEEWDYSVDPPMKMPAQRFKRGPIKKLVFYPHWRNIERVMEDYEKGLRAELPKMPPKHLWGDGKVYHVKVNKTGEMVFGHPMFDRTIGWFNAYNRFMDARVDLMEASAAFVMKRKIKGTPTQLRKMATQAISRRSALGMASRVDPATGEALPPAPRAGILNENEGVEHEQFNLNTNATNAAEDARMLGAQISAAHRFPRGFFGDTGNSSLAEATSLELPVLKGVGRFQEVVEGIVRFSVDRQIERAVEVNRIPKDLTEEERAELAAKKQPERQNGAPPNGPLGYAGPPPLALGGPPDPSQMQQAHEDAVDDEAQTERDLGYKFKMPNPLQRAMSDLVTAVQTTAQVFDPNNTNMEMTRELFAIVLEEVFEHPDPAAAVEKIFPEGYVDPAVAAQQAMMGAGGPGNPYGEFAPGADGHMGADGQRHPASNPYGAPMRAQPPEVAMQQARHRAQLRGRDGRPVEMLEALVAAGGMVPVQDGYGGVVLIPAATVQQFFAAMPQEARSAPETAEDRRRQVEADWDKAFGNGGGT